MSTTSSPTWSRRWRRRDDRSPVRFGPFAMAGEAAPQTDETCSKSPGFSRIPARRTGGSLVPLVHETASKIWLNHDDPSRSRSPGPTPAGRWLRRKRGRSLRHRIVPVPRAGRFLQSSSSRSVGQRSGRDERSIDYLAYSSPLAVMCTVPCGYWVSPQSSRRIASRLPTANAIPIPA